MHAFLDFGLNFRREDREVGKRRGKQEDDAAGDVAHDSEFVFITGRDFVGVEAGGHEVDVMGVVSDFEVGEDAGPSDEKAGERDGADEEEGIAFGDEVLLLRAAIADAGDQGDKAADQSTEGEEAGFQTDFLNVGAFRLKSAEIDGTHGDAGAEQDGDEREGEDLHDLVGVLAFPVHMHEGDADADDREDEKDDVNNDDEGQINFGREVGRGQTIEPHGVEEEEDSGQSAKGDVAAKRLADGFIAPTGDERTEGEEQTEAGNNRAGKAEARQQNDQTDGDVGQIDAVGDRELGDDVGAIDEPKPDTKERESGEQNSKHDRVDETN